uniref:Uncharacterized protein n=1 Tax=Leersia perrieri TaxID=77586 RepID=A0A0D9XMR3_9ORYZ
MRTQRSYSSAASALCFCKVLLMVLALISTLHTASVEGGRAAAATIGGMNGALDPTYTPRVAPGRPYTRPCGAYYNKCPPQAAGSP